MMPETGEPPCFDDGLLNLIRQNDADGDIEACCIIESKGLAHLTNESGDTLLHFAAKYHCAGVVKYLIESGSEVNARNVGGKTPIMLAVESFSPVRFIYCEESVKLLCESYANIHINDNDGNSAARVVLGCTNVLPSRVIKLFFQIIQKECDNDCTRIAEKLMSLESPLWVAVLSENTDVTEQMIIRGCPVNDVGGRIALETAIGIMNLKIFELLIKYGADVTSKNDRGKTLVASYYSAHAKIIQQPKILEMLLSKIDFEDDDGLARDITWLCLTGTKESLRVLVEHSSNILKAKGFENKTPLHFLVANNCLDVFEAIEDQNFDVNARDVHGRTALLCATASALSHSGTFKFLLNNGADINARCNRQVSPLFSLCEKLAGEDNQAVVLKILSIFLEHNADIQMTGPHYVQIDLFDRIMEHQTTVFDILMRKRTFYMAKPMIAHLVLIEELGNTIEDYIRDKINSHPMFQNYFNLCKRKLQNMKRATLGGRVTLFKMLVDRKAKFAESCTNTEKLLLRLKSLRKKCLSRYYYSAIIRKRIPSIIMKIQLIQKTAPILSKLLQLGNDPNHIVVRKIIEYLNNEDMRILSRVNV